MCELLALSCNSPASITFAFTGFSARGGHTGEHADGFGLAFHHGNGCRLFVDEGRANDAALAEFLRRHPIRARTVLGHIRKATQGEVELSNCHPFVREWQGRQWSFCHNGDLKNYHPRLSGVHVPVGSTDSERAFCFMLQSLRRRFRGKAVVGWQQLAPVIADLAADIGRHGTFNFLMCDGEAVYAYASTRLAWVQRRHPFGVATLIDAELSIDLDRVNAPTDKMVLVATDPLTHDERWHTFAAGELRVFSAGEPVWSSAAEGLPLTRAPIPAMSSRFGQRLPNAA